MPFAENTTVTPERSQMEISSILRRYGADGFAFGWEPGQAMVGFRAHDRQVRFVLPIPLPNDPQFKTSPGGRTRNKDQQQAACEQEQRRRWRALCLAIKAKLEVVDTGISTFEEEFLAHLVLPNGKTVGESVAPAIQEAYETGRMVPLLAIEG